MAGGLSGREIAGKSAIEPKRGRAGCRGGRNGRSGGVRGKRWYTHSIPLSTTPPLLWWGTQPVRHKAPAHLTSMPHTGGCPFHSRPGLEGNACGQPDGGHARAAGQHTDLAFSKRTNSLCVCICASVCVCVWPVTHASIPNMPINIHLFPSFASIALALT